MADHHTAADGETEDFEAGTSAGSAAPTPGDLSFLEIQRVERIFELFELSTGRVGQGRQRGERKETWGAITVLARSALEQAIRRLHRARCDIEGCRFEKVNFQPVHFFELIDRHSGQEFNMMDESLHLRLRQKKEPNRGSGSGQPVNGPLTKREFEEGLNALNWVRNGFDHHNVKKIERLPKGDKGEDHPGEWTYWVAGANDPWTVQKPHAFSAIRLCHLLHRLVVAEWWDVGVAMGSRSQPILYITDRYHDDFRSPMNVVHDMKTELELTDLSDKKRLNHVLDLVEVLQRSILGSEVEENGQEALFEMPAAANVLLSEPRVRTRALPGKPHGRSQQAEIGALPFQVRTMKDTNVGRVRGSGDSDDYR